MIVTRGFGEKQTIITRGFGRFLAMPLAYPIYMIGNIIAYLEKKFIIEAEIC